MAEPVRDIRDVQVRLGRLRQDWDSFVSGNYDRHGLRLINNGRSVDIGDYVIRGEINDLIREALINLDKIEIPQVTNIFSGGGGSGLQNPLVESILASMDSTYDIGEPALGNRVRWGFADVWNAETLEITDITTHALHWQFIQDPVTSNELDLKDPAANILATFALGSVEFFQNIILGNDGVANISAIQANHPTLGVNSLLTNDWTSGNVALNSPAELLVLASYNATPALVGALELYTRTDSNMVLRPSSLGGIPLTNYFLGDLATPWQEIYALQLTARFVSGAAPLVRWDDQAGTNNWAYIVGPPAGGSSWIVELPNIGTVAAGNVLADSGVAGVYGRKLQWLSLTNPPYSIVPATDSAYDLGSTSNRWANLWVDTINGGTGYLTNPLTSSLLVGTDSLYDFGQSGVSPRVRNIYADVVNAEILEITNVSTHASRWQFIQDPSTSNELDLKQPSNAIVVTFKTSAIEFFQDVILGNNGSSDVRDLIMRGNVRGAQPVIQMEWTTDNVAFQSPGPLAILSSYHTTPAKIGALELQTTSAGNGVFRPSSTGGVTLTNYFLGDLNTPFQEIYALQLTARRISGAAPLVRWDDQSGNNHWVNFVGPVSAGGSSWTIELPKVGPVTAGDVLAYSGASGSYGKTIQWLSVTDPPYNIVPATHNTYNLGSSTFVWANTYIKNLTLGKAAATRLQGILTIANATDSNVFLLKGISKDGVGTAEVTGSLAIGSSDNFYGRVYSGGDVNCATGGPGATALDDGWMGFRTDTNELQVCIGGALKKVTLT